MKNQETKEKPEAPLAAAAGYPTVPLTEDSAKAFGTLHKCVLALQPRGDPMADDIWTAMCILSRNFGPLAKPSDNEKAHLPGPL